LLLDNYYKKVTDFFTEQPTTSSSDSQGERVSIKMMRENFEKKRHLENEGKGSFDDQNAALDQLADQQRRQEEARQ